MSLKKILFASLFGLSLYLLPKTIFSDDIQKANKYYEKYDYKLALEIYEKVMQKKPSLDVAQKLANCYRFINNSEGAESAYAKVLSFPAFDPLNYRYYADALKQNGKFEEAKKNYHLYGQSFPAMSEEATRLANSCDVARIWAESPDPNVQVLSETTINSEYSEFSPVKVNNAIVFVSDRWFVEGSAKNNNTVYGWTGNPYLKMYQLEANKVSILPREINGQYHNGPAAFNRGGDTIYLTRVSVGRKKKNEINVGRKSIWVSVKKGNEWIEPSELNLNSNSDYSTQHPALSPDGNTLYFASDIPGGLGGMDIYYSVKNSNGSWEKPVNCGPTINTPEDEVFPFVRPDGKFFFASKGHIGMGGLDLFSCVGERHSFGTPENLKSPLNSTKDDFGIWMEDEMAGYLSSNRSGGKGLDDIYRFTIVPTKAIYAVEGEVVDKATGMPLSGIDIILLNKTKGLEVALKSDIDGRFRFNLEPDMEYVVTGDKERYYSRQEGEISTKNIKESTIFNVRFELEKAPNALLVRLNNIYYDFNKWNIRPDARPELNRVVAFLNSTPDVNIELRSHTDSRGPAVYNDYLSQKRAESAVDFLKDNGVTANRVSAKGLGESELLNRCRDGVKCTVKDHQMNRRTEFKVIKINASPSSEATVVAKIRRK